jgi:serine/threonine-protein kinase
MAVEAGRVLGGRYRLVKPVGQGAQAAVWIADHLALSTQVAVKLIDPDLAKQADALARFKREATAAAQLRSPNVVQIMDHGVDGDQPFIVMELLLGEDLFERLEKRGRLTLREASTIVTQVARALTRAHAAGIVHRDLKPENVFLVENEDDEVAKVLDFGVAKVKDPAKHTMQRTGIGTLIGTPHYMSPEQVKGVGDVDFRSDIWALGVITYQLVTGQLPFDSEGVGDLLIRITIGEIPVPSSVVPTLPATFDAWFARACDRDPDKRFQSARELADALAKAVGAERTQTGVPRPERASLLDATKAKPPPPPKRSAVAEDLDDAELEEASDAQEIADALAAPARLPLESADVDVELGESVHPAESVEPAAAKLPPIPQHKPIDAALEPWAPVLRTPPSVRPAPPSSGVPSSTVSGLASSGLTSLPPPELDGTRKRRKLAWFVVLVLAGAAAGAWFGFKPQILAFQEELRHPAAAPVEATPTTANTPTVLAVPTAVVFEPAGSLASAAPTAKPAISPASPPAVRNSFKPKHGKAKPGASEPVIEIPNTPDDHGTSAPKNAAPPPEPEAPSDVPPPAP